MFSIALILAAVAPQAATAASPSPTPDYRDASAWLCRPGSRDACAQDQGATVIAADGTRTAAPFKPATDPKFDCFYVYPTVSTDPTPNSDMTADLAERRVIQFQAARFGSVCRVFAPLYRQITLTALRTVMTGGAVAMDRAMAYDDVKLAWDDYLKRDNDGRGVVLVGHSQGAGLLKQLLAREIEGKPVAARIVSAMLIGTNVAVPAGKDVGGDLKIMPLCRTADQVGCVVTYVSFRADAPPPANSRFGKVDGAGLTAGCTNPAALAGGKAIADAYLSSGGAIASTAAAPGPWTSDGAPVTTPFVKAPGLLSTECVSAGGFTYLAVTTNADASDPRTDSIVGDVTVGPTILKDWGLHLIDMNLAMGDLVTLADRQAKAWRAQRK